MSLPHASRITRAPTTCLDRRPGFTIHFAASNRLAFVMRLFSTREADEHFDAAVLEVHLERHQRESLFGCSSNQLPDLVSVQQKLALASLGMFGVAAVAVGTDMHIQHPDLTAVGACVAVAQIDASFADRLDLRAEERDARLVGFENVIVVACLAIVGNEALCLLALVLFGHGSTNILDGLTTSCSLRTT